jgi:hypothetical protein
MSEIAVHNNWSQQLNTISSWRTLEAVKTGVFAVTLLLSSVRFAQQVSIRMVNSSNGQPLPGWKVDVYFVNPTQGKDAVKGSQHFQTDADGMARFTLPQPIPEVLNVYAHSQTEKWYVGSFKANTMAVLQKGSQSKGFKTHGKVIAYPGQILILAKPVTVWDKIVHEIVYTILGPLERE